MTHLDCMDISQLREEDFECLFRHTLPGAPDSAAASLFYTVGRGHDPADPVTNFSK